VHLEQDIGREGAIDWLGSADMTADLTRPPSYHDIPQLLQEKIAAIRTDLDTFSEAEAYTLMTTGYRMAQLTTQYDKTTQWDFLEVEPVMMNQPGFERAYGELLRLLDTGSETLFKTWRLMPMLRGVTKIVAVLGLGALLYAGYLLPDWGYFEPPVNIRVLAVIVAVFVGFWFLLNRARKYLNFDGTLSEMAISILIVLFGWILAQFQIRVFDRAFKWFGSMKRLRGLTRKS